MKKNLFAFIAIAAILFGMQQVNAQKTDNDTGSLYRRADSSKHGVVSCFSSQAAKVGIDVLNRGGNAADAAIAMVFATGVTRPDMSGIGGGGFLLARSKTGEVRALDFRETAPSAVDTNTFKGEGIHKDSTNVGTVGSGHMVIGVPGTVRGMAEALDKLGSGNFSLCQLISSGVKPHLYNTLPDITEPKTCGNNSSGATVPYAYELAHYGMEVSGQLSQNAVEVSDRFHYYIETFKIYAPIPAYFSAQEPFRQAGVPVPTHLLFKQPDCAASLALIMEKGADAFYTGWIADSITNDMKKGPRAIHPDSAKDIGLMTAVDLANYRPIWREPLSINYRNYQVYGMPPPASGGVTTLQTLNLLEHFPLGSTNWKQSSANHFHVLAEAQKIAWADRNAYSGDPAFLGPQYLPDLKLVPNSKLISKEYAQEQVVNIDMNKAKPLVNKNPNKKTPNKVGQPDKYGTMHITVLDKEGNAVSITNSIDAKFGSIVVAPGTGFLLNSTLVDFNQDAPGTANEARGGKRPRSGSSPTIVVGDGKPVLVTGGAGGGRIIMGVVQSIVNVVDFGRTIAHAVDDERVDAVAVYEGNESDLYADSTNYLGIEDKRVDASVINNLKMRGHKVEGKRDGFYRVAGPVGFLYFSDSSDYHYLPYIMAVGYNPKDNWNRAIADPRVGDYSGDYGAAGQPDPKPKPTPSTLTVLRPKAEQIETNSSLLSITVTPNPSTQYFTLQLRSKDSKAPISLRVVDRLGRVVEQQTRLVAGQTLQIGHSYRSGMYQVEAVQGRERVVVKLIKQAD